MKQIKNYRKSFLFLCLTAFFLVVLFLGGCQSKRARLLKETSWYENSVKWYDVNYPGVKSLKINTPSIWIGKVVKIENSLKEGKISNIYLEDAERLKPYAMFSQDLNLWASEKNFNSNIPKVGEYWAFRVIHGLKGNMHINKAVKVIYNSSTDTLRIIDPLNLTTNSNK